MPNLAVVQLRAAIDKIDKIYGLRFKAVGFHVLGKLMNEDDRREIQQWIVGNAVMPYGDMRLGGGDGDSNSNRHCGGQCFFGELRIDFQWRAPPARLLQTALHRWLRGRR